MNKFYLLGKNKTRFDLEEFPKISPDEKIGVIYEADIESTLLCVIAREIYGLERVVFINDKLISFDGTLPQDKDDDKLEIVKRQFAQGIERFRAVHTLTVDSKIYKKHTDASLEFKNFLLQKYKGKMKYILAGYNKIHEQSMDMLKASGWHRGHITNDKLKPWLEKNSVRYPELFAHVFKNNGKIYGVLKDIDYEQIKNDYELSVRPFRNLTTSDVIDLYDKLNELSMLYQSTSCDVDLGNCGICSNCHHRKLAFKNSSVTDLTKYTFN